MERGSPGTVSRRFLEYLSSHPSSQTHSSTAVPPGKWKAETLFTVRRLLVVLVLFVLLGALSLVWLRTHDSAPTAPESGSQTAIPIIDKQPPVVATRRFDPATPPPDMPPLHAGEQAQCESNFMSGAMVSSQRRRTGATSAMVTVTQVKMMLQLGITIWVPDDVTQKVLEHEEGHRQISESYYASADQLARRIAASYIGKQVTVTGDDLDAEANKMLQQIGADITAEYSRQLDPEPAQLRYDAITDHARNDVLASDALTQVLRESLPPH